MVISTGRQENRAITVSLRHRKPKYARVKAERALQVGNFQVYVSNAHVLVNSIGGVVAGLFMDEAISEIVTAISGVETSHVQIIFPSRWIGLAAILQNRAHHASIRPQRRPVSRGR